MAATRTCRTCLPWRTVRTQACNPPARRSRCSSAVKAGLARRRQPSTSSSTSRASVVSARRGRVRRAWPTLKRGSPCGLAWPASARPLAASHSLGRRRRQRAGVPWGSSRSSCWTQIPCWRHSGMRKPSATTTHPDLENSSKFTLTHPGPSWAPPSKTISSRSHVLSLNRFQSATTTSFISCARERQQKRKQNSLLARPAASHTSPRASVKRSMMLMTAKCLSV
mmetsp:Transcript_20878/g.52869  ORF Transcript_20878/g.52869 Transcript_20878/m.52869 type:complete len:224 (-) Transcript_20878:2184-2855(-)